MRANTMFRDPRVRFSTIGPKISEFQIHKAIPEAFAGKDDFVRFYLQHNGGYFNKFALIYRDTFQEVPRGRVNSLPIQGFYSIPREPGEKVKGFPSMLAGKADTLIGYGQRPNMRSFIESHIPFAYDGSGDDHWIEVPTGRIWFVDMESVEKGPLEIAPSFLDFVSNLVGDWRDEDKI